MKLIEVKDKQTAKAFLELPLDIYRAYPNWIRPLDKDIEEVFDPKQNKFFRHGAAIRWILQDDSGTVIGRVAAFINKKTAKKFDQPTGGMGFFECIDNEIAAFKLFDACKGWLEAHGMEAMDGPVNFGERDRWWGLLVDGIEHEPNYCCNYHPPYYRKLFEAYGFKIYFKQYTYFRNIKDPIAAKYRDRAARIARNPKYHFEHLRKKELKKYAEHFTTIYNQAWAGHEGVKKISNAQAMRVMQKMKPVIDEELIWYAYYDKEPVGFFIVLPELNQFFKHVNGKLDWWGKLKFLWHKWRGTNKKTLGVVFGVVPEHQHKGLEGSIVVEGGGHIQTLKRYKTFEMNWIGDFNPKMMHIAEAVGGRVIKTHITYRKLFDESKPFKRAPVIK